MPRVVQLLPAAALASAMILVPALAAAQPSPDALWAADATAYRNKPDQQVTYFCPSVPTLPGNAVWGSGPYTDDSSICVAAVHAGYITPQDGGTVTIMLTGPQDSFAGTERNGVSTFEYGAWEGSFAFVGEPSVITPTKG